MRIAGTTSSFTAAKRASLRARGGALFSLLTVREHLELVAICANWLRTRATRG